MKKESQVDQLKKNQRLVHELSIEGEDYTQ